MSSGGIYPLEKEEPADFCWEDRKAINRVIIKSGPIKDSLQELDFWGQKLHLSMTPGRPRGHQVMRLRTRGNLGEVEVDYSSACEAITEFDCSQEISQEYRFSLLQPLIKALVLAEKVCFRLGQSGMLQVCSASMLLALNLQCVRAQQSSVCFRHLTEGSSCSHRHN